MSVNITVIIIVVLVVFRMMRRAQRMFSWQRLKARRLWIVSAIMGTIGSLLFIGGASHVESLISNTLGIVLGILLAYFGALYTRYEQQEGIWKYRSNEWIGGAVTALFFGRVAYRVYQMIDQGLLQDDARFAESMQSFGGSWTSGLTLIMFAYYLAYNLYLLRKNRMLVSSR